MGERSRWWAPPPGIAHLVSIPFAFRTRSGWPLNRSNMDLTSHATPLAPSTSSNMGPRWWPGRFHWNLLQATELLPFLLVNSTGHRKKNGAPSARRLEMVRGGRMQQSQQQQQLDPLGTRFVDSESRHCGGNRLRFKAFDAAWALVKACTRHSQNRDQERYIQTSNATSQSDYCVGLLQGM